MQRAAWTCRFFLGQRREITVFVVCAYNVCNPLTSFVYLFLIYSAMCLFSEPFFCTYRLKRSYLHIGSAISVTVNLWHYLTLTNSNFLTKAPSHIGF